MLAAAAVTQLGGQDDIKCLPATRRPRAGQACTPDVRMPVPHADAIGARNVMDDVKATRHGNLARRSIPAASSPTTG